MSAIDVEDEDEDLHELVKALPIKLVEGRESKYKPLLLDVLEVENTAQQTVPDLLRLDRAPLTAVGATVVQQQFAAEGADEPPQTAEERAMWRTLRRVTSCDRCLK